MSDYTLYFDDCLSAMKNIEDKSIDMILVYPPYNTTLLHWDKLLNFESLWEQYHRIAKPNAAIAIFAQEPFATFVRMSNMKEYRYDWYWKKNVLLMFFK